MYYTQLAHVVVGGFVVVQLAAVTFCSLSALLRF